MAKIVISNGNPLPQALGGTGYTSLAALFTAYGIPFTAPNVVTPVVVNAFFNRAVARASAQSRPAKILVYGHSHVAGEGAGTGTLGLNGAAPLGFVARLPAKLTAIGINSEEQSFFGDGNVGLGNTTFPQYDPRVALGSGWSSDTAPSPLGGRFLIQAAGGTGSLDFTPGYTFTSSRIWYPRTSGLSTSTSVLVDNVQQTTFSNVGSDALLYTDVAATGSKISVKNLAGSGSSYISAIECFRSTSARIYNAGWCGALSSDLNATFNPWYSRNGAAALAPDLSVVYCMTNDIINSVSAATWKANAKSITQILQASGEVIIVIDPPAQNFDATLYQQYADAANQIASETGCGILDLKTLFVSYANSVAKGWQFDSNHPSLTGHDKIATAFVTAFATAPVVDTSGAPNGFIYLADPDGSRLTDADGAYLMEAV
jgi:hypothetical protein